MEKIQRITVYLVTASGKCPVITTIMIFLFMMLFNLMEAHIETLIFGEPFKHWLDVLFMGGFMAYTAYAVYICAIMRRNDT